MSVNLSDPDPNFSKLKVAELKLELKKRGLSTDGKKGELIERLKSSLGDSSLLDDTHDDLLDDEDLSDGVLDETAIETALETTETKSTKRAANDEENPQPKKIVLNRKVVEAPIVTSEPVVVTESITESPKVVAKISALSMDERLAKRKARFSGGSAVEVSETVKEASAPKIVSNNATIDVLKKRAERFGTVAPVLEKAQLEEKKLQRMQRFGADAKSGTNSVDKKAQRAARFQISS